MTTLADPEKRHSRRPVVGLIVATVVACAVILLVRNTARLDFAAAMAFANRVGDIAEQQGHHPDLHISWGKCAVEIWTHKINGLTESDFYLAAKADREFEPFRAMAG